MGITLRPKKHVCTEQFQDKSIKLNLLLVGLEAVATQPVGPTVSIAHRGGEQNRNVDGLMGGLELYDLSGYSPPLHSTATVTTVLYIMMTHTVKYASLL